MKRGSVPAAIETADEADQPPSAVDRRRRRAVLAGAAAVFAVAVVVAGTMGLGGGGSGEAGSRLPRTGATVQVTRETLTDAATVDGELNHGPEVPLGVKGAGTVTWLPADGTTVRRGGTLLRVDDRPVVLLYGKLPMYRSLAGPGTAGDSPAADSAEDTASPDPRSAAPPNPETAGPVQGRDVRQLGSNLKALGYSGFTVDETYTAATAEAVKRWQRDLGVPATGVVGVGDVFYASGPVRIAHALLRLGAEATGDVLSYTGTKRMVTVEAPVNDVGWAERGARVSVNLPDGRSVPGKVTSVGGEAAPPQEQKSAAVTGGDQPADAGGDNGADSQNPSVAVVIDIPDQHKLGRLQRSPVTVQYVVKKREDVLTVPVSALVALAEGGYGIEVVEGRSSHFVAVHTGLFADGRVEVSGAAVRAGMTVRIPQ